MRVMMLSWEYPPFSVGGLAQHVYELSRAMAAEGIEVTVLTTAPDEPGEENVDGVIVHRVRPCPGNSLDFISWVQRLNMAFLEKGAKLFNRKSYDIIHGHDWLVCYAARGLKNVYHTPLIATVHATEYGRNNGLHTDEQKYIGEIEWQLTYDSWFTICCSNFMEEEVAGVFGLPRNKIRVIPNGIRSEAFKIKAEEPAVRERFAPHGEKIIFYVGRLVQEKGVQDLLRALPLVKEQHDDVKFVIAGTGPYQEELMRISAAAGLADYLTFTGYIDDRLRNQLYHLASVAVFPSRYEPFGIVALEGMATGTPVVVGDTGGFNEIIKHGQNGLKAYPEDPHSLAGNINTLLSSPEVSEQISANAMQEIQARYSWHSIARRTAETYREIVLSADAIRWKNELNELNKGYDVKSGRDERDERDERYERDERDEYLTHGKHGKDGKYAITPGDEFVPAGKYRPPYRYEAPVR